MSGGARQSVILALFSLPNLFLFAELPLNSKATYPEIPYYLRQLQETDQEGKRMELNKTIHEAVVSADLSDPRVVKKMEPIIEKIQIAADSGLDRPYLEGESMWLMSAVDYFEREKGRKSIDIPATDWMPNQTESSTGLRITTFPDKVLLHDGEKTTTIVESANIHEAVISPDGRFVAFSRRTDEQSRAEVWVTDVKSRKRKKIASLPSCHTLLFSLNGARVYMQERPAQPQEETPFYSVSRSGGKPHLLGKVRLLNTLVAQGPYKGDLVVFKNVIHHLGTTKQECAFALKENGKEEGKIKDGPCR